MKLLKLFCPLLGIVTSVGQGMSMQGSKAGEFPDVASPETGQPAFALELFEVATALLTNETITLEIRALIDGRDRLIVRGTTLQWEHLDNAAVGRHEGQNFPTIVTTTVNGVTQLNAFEWIPGWYAPPPDEIRSPAFSTSFTGLVPSMPQQSTIESLQMIRARSNVLLVQTPRAGNNFTTIIEFDDNSELGSDWYHARLTYQIPEAGSVSLLIVGTAFVGARRRRRSRTASGQ